MQVAIEHALMVLGWMENHSKEDMPHESIWEDPDALERWWNKVRERQEHRASGGGRSSRSAGDDDSDMEDLEENELARAFKE